MQSLSNESKTVWSGVLLAGSEYPFAAFKEMMSSVNTDLKTAKDPEIAEIYEYIADQSLNKTSKILFKLANPSCLIKNYPKLCNMFFNTGTVEVQVAESGHAVLRFPCQRSLTTGFRLHVWDIQKRPSRWPAAGTWS